MTWATITMRTRAGITASASDRTAASMTFESEYRCTAEAVAENIVNDIKNEVAAGNRIELIIVAYEDAD